MSSNPSRHVYVLQSHDEDSGDRICGVYSTRDKALQAWKRKPSFETDRAFGVGHTIKKVKVQ